MTYVLDSLEFSDMRECQAAFAWAQNEAKPTLMGLRRFAWEDFETCAEPLPSFWQSWRPWP